MEFVVIFIAIIFEVFLISRNIQYGALGVFLIYCMIPLSFGINIGVRMNIMTLILSVYLFCSYLKIRKWNNTYNPDIERVLRLYCVYVLISSFYATLLSPYPNDYVRNTIAFIINFVLMPYILCHISNDQGILKKINTVLVIFGIVVGVYGILNYILKSNPYLVYMTSMTGTSASSDHFLMSERGFLQGRVSSFFSHPLSLGQISIIMLGYGIFSFKKIRYVFLRRISLILLGLMCVFCGSRSAIIPLGVVIFLYVLYSNFGNKIKYIFLICVVACVAYLYLPESYKSVIKGFFYVWNDDYAERGNIGGSSLEMRMNQFNDGLNIIEDNPLFGMGQGYVSMHGKDHEEMLGYESYVLQFFVVGGFVGVIVFTLYYFYLYISLLHLCKGKLNKAKVHSLCLSYYINILFTGIQTGSFSIFIIFYFWLKSEIQGCRCCCRKDEKENVVYS